MRSLLSIVLFPHIPLAVALSAQMSYTIIIYNKALGLTLLFRVFCSMQCLLDFSLDYLININCSFQRNPFKLKIGILGAVDFGPGDDPKACFELQKRFSVRGPAFNPEVKIRTCPNRFRLKTFHFLPNS